MSKRLRQGVGRHDGRETYQLGQNFILAAAATQTRHHRRRCTLLASPVIYLRMVVEKTVRERLY